MKILVANNKTSQNAALIKELKANGYAVENCADCQDAQEYLETSSYDLFLFDIRKPSANGLEVINRIRSKGTVTPIIILSPSADISDKIKGLDSGANDYLTITYSFQELCARIRAVTRTVFKIPSNLLTAADLTLDTSTHQVKRGNTNIRLTRQEYLLLEYLVRNKNIVLSKRSIENHVWSYDYEGGSNIVAVYISYLRKKIDAQWDTKLIHTIHHIGYCLTAPEK